MYKDKTFQGLRQHVTCYAMQPVAFVTKYDKGKTVAHPFSNYTVVMVVQGYATVFLEWRYLGSEERHKAATLNCVPQGVVCGVCSEHTVLFLFF